MIICLGTSPAMQRTMTFDAFNVNQVNRARWLDVTPSGKPLNVARVLHVMEVPVTFCGFLGGLAGGWIEETLGAIGIASEVVQTRTPTRTCITILDSGRKTTTELVEEALPVNHAEFVQLLDGLDKLLPHASVLVCSGSLAPGVPADFYATCTERAHRAGVGIVVDATGEAMRHAIKARPTVLKLNRDELSNALERDLTTDASLAAAARELVQGHTQWVCVTMGEQGALAADAKGCWRVKVPRVEPVNPIGSGDAFAAGIAISLDKHLELSAAAQYAAACSVANVTTPVAGRVHPRDVEALLPQVRVERFA